MKAIIMAGGAGSRLRPLTCGRPKPIVPIMNKSVMGRIIDQKKLSPLMPAMKKLLRKYPMVAKAMEERPAIYNRQVAELEAREARGETFVIRPPESLGIHRTESDPRELQRVYFIGRKEAEKQLSAMKEFLAK